MYSFGPGNYVVFVRPLDDSKASHIKHNAENGPIFPDIRMYVYAMAHHALLPSLTSNPKNLSITPQGIKEDVRTVCAQMVAVLVADDV
jgi:hypothetical protein